MSVSAQERASLVTARGWAAYGLAAASVVVDQLSKLWVVDDLRLGEGGTIPVLPYVRLTMVWNRGVSYGLLAAHDALGRWGLVIFSLVVVVALVAWARNQVRWAPTAAIGLIMGGALGNALDRARIGHVVDFIDVSALRFPWVFNVADSCISVGVALLLVDSFTARKTP